MLKIKEVREKRKLSQDDVVKATGIPKRSYVNYENEITDIPLSKLQNIASALKVNIQELISGGVDTGEGLAQEEAAQYPSLKEFHADLKKDLAALAEGMTKNFEVVSKGIMQGLKDQQKVVNFIKDLDAKEISTASKGLNEFLQEKE